ncbi:aminodeoxychorismate synthase component I [Allosediminivita pacifica]|uniref:Aminodeoxychorismate synthase subunit I n=1 Tax=Allosediminivita pacifica TaxID=1267769 RepID=A0A2T6B9X9_9RHOB|nr:aminodeoxychorismate synthase component I [Allosediminivita pacifica]PTX52864.1 aminodeoxychorismate synthase subunit I [Allosediminivita pacifica]GGA95204.1 aminodeoxychorismate synthase component I [Allosediminivita pacifica]
MARVSFDRGPLGSGTLFADPVRLISAQTAREVPAAFAALEAARREGLWLAGLASYELGYALDAKLAPLMPPPGEVPLMLFGAFKAPLPARPEAPGQSRFTAPRPLWDAARYAEAFGVVHDYICAGDIYQANLTFPMEARHEGTARALYARLRARQEVPYGALVDLGGPAILSRSPELFFSLDTKGTLTTRPMKGTAPRGANPEADAALAEGLRRSEKNRAENLMIVDLLRNDMSRVSLPGSVKVPELFTVERYETLHQMTSRITSQVRPGTGVADLFAALFPCGSITGAPKIRAMEILRDLEEGPRGAYCGAVGWMAPDGAMTFNVAIRTLTCFADGRVDLNVGGGVVYDSTAEEEYAEALLKSRFANLD